VEKCTRGGYFEHPSYPHRTSYRREIYKFAIDVRVLQDLLF